MYLAWSEKEIMDFLIARVHHSAPREFIVLLKKMNIMEQKNSFDEMIRRMNEMEESREDKNNSVEVHNAGLMLIAPFFPMLFHRLGMLADDRRNFKNDECRMRAIFLLQYLVYQGQKEWPENELYLNKKIVGWESGNNPLPNRIELNDKETETTVEMLTSICRTWDKMRNTSIEGFRRSFLERKGVVSVEGDGVLLVKVEERAYDVLLDSLPWGFKMFRFSWTTNIFKTNWR